MDINSHISSYNKFASGIDHDLEGPIGTEHYRLLAYLSTQLNDQHIFDIGTNHGHSAYALSYNGNNTVHTFDLVDAVTHPTIKTRTNIEFNLCNLLDPSQREKWVQLLIESPLIFLDVDPHDGIKEIAFYDMLKEINYTGLLVCDDIWYFKDMRDKFWSQIPDKYRYDWTQYGHWSGTGVIDFSQGVGELSHLLPIKPNNDDWTLVTALYDLSKCPDATTYARSIPYYLAHAHSVMSCPYNLVVYCDKENFNQLVEMRPPHLKEKTRYIVCEFDQLKFEGHGDKYDTLTFKEYRDMITHNRITHPYNMDPRNNPSYYLFCISRNMMVKRAIKENPFKSTHFAWINICIERMGYKNLIHLDEALGTHRDKFSTAYIDYIPNELVNKTAEYFIYGRCSMCSGFYTGNSEYMYKVCHEIESQFLAYLEQGYGHADEQLFSPVFFKNRDLFEQYYGDYVEMITNYTHVYENPNKILSIFIKNSFDNKAYNDCYKGCRFLWKSYLLKTCDLSSEQLDKLIHYKNYSKIRGTLPP